MITGQRIKERRQLLGMTQEELAALVHTTQKQISRYEGGFNDPRGQIIAALAQALHTSTDYLLGVVDTPHVYRGHTGVRILAED
jgi:transcriptional regulator with XRE-family HTH domain